jgi:hypothetical protein
MDITRTGARRKANPKINATMEAIVIKVLSFMLLSPFE